MTVRQLEMSLSSRELMEWMIYHSVEPFGPPRDDHRAGVVATVIAMANGAKQAKPADFFPPFKPEKRQPKKTKNENSFSDEQNNQMQFMQALAAALGGKKRDRSEIQGPRVKGVRESTPST